MKLYHGTSKANARAILRKGLKLSKTSKDLFLGRAFYFKHSAEGAKQYGDTVLEVNLETKICKASKMEGIGTFEQWAEIECENGNKNCCELRSSCLKKYNTFAEGERQIRLNEGCVAVDDGTQVAIFDEKLLKKLKPKLLRG